MPVTALMPVEDIAYVEYMKTIGRLVITNAEGRLPKEATEGVVYLGFTDGFRGGSMNPSIVDKGNPNRQERLVYIGAYRQGKSYAKNFQ